MAARFPLIANSSANQIQELASGDDMDLTGSSITGAGIITATSFDGNLTKATTTASAITGTGVLTISNTTDSTSSTTGAVIISGGVGIAKSLFVGNNVTIGGTITYEDVTNVDSVGIITAQTGVKVTAGGIDVTAGGLKITAGVTTFSNEVTASGGVDINGGLDVAGVGTFATGVKLSGGEVTLGTGATVFSPASNTLTVGTASTEVIRINNKAGIILNNGILVERCKIVSTAWNTTNDISLDDGNVFLNTANLGGTGTTIDITSSNGLNSDMAIGDSTSVTLITAVNATTAYINHITIAASAVTESWVGGSAPSDGGGSGYDVYSFNIIKTAANTYVCIANQVKGS